MSEPRRQSKREAKGAVFAARAVETRSDGAAFATNAVEHKANAVFLPPQSSSRVVLPGAPEAKASVFGSVGTEAQGQAVPLPASWQQSGNGSAGKGLSPSRQRKREGKASAFGSTAVQAQGEAASLPLSPVPPEERLGGGAPSAWSESGESAARTDCTSAAVSAGKGQWRGSGRPGKGSDKGGGPRKGSDKGAAAKSGVR